MFTGTPDELRRKERDAVAIGEQIAELLNKLDALAPGSVRAHNGRITGPNVTVRQLGARWALDT
ncbi:hypothetical protein ACWCXC_31590 [Streptomyces sp. NPDC001515]